MSDYIRIEKAMTYMSEHVSSQPSLEDVAAHVHLSPFHFHRVFCKWAGTTPKRFLQALTLERSKRMLKEEGSLMDVSLSMGLSGGSRLYDHFVKLEAVTPGEYRNGGQGITIQYGVNETPFGKIFVAMTPRGVCRIEFLGSRSADEILVDIGKDWPKGSLVQNDNATNYVANVLFSRLKDGQSNPLSLHVMGTNFQVAVWRALLRIPPGQLASYSQIANALGYPKASRAVGNAVGSNPVAMLIPCHRVIQKSGAIGGYRWGSTKKEMIQAWELLRGDPLKL
ncbi:MULTISPECIES: methylated-DNA--[protein]-cysteine S-methyltransferase [Idiomarina]|mgnify:FL=1|jgi:AraC family transcriptional regulator of adaptative response/methylated-DNA-[protein]-cysteine methyltransferase|uniref:bifunctional transcriptional activator/DNA repair enzyme AdaA n=1 Tax=Idiomarina TaxID=135575 RepID=UPI000C64321E|nr:MULTISPECIES: methylated-DNA--[protein]-cysteine S-methyltransferase [Idiomarina]MAO68968.1 6-O-methylguanine DNA methyltransferase [Idiomarina sp.]MBF80983.1 6-O-methylguanine DNA methyltransferase [Idiomarina sp.]MDA6067429.1 methylated-DNA--[protein]-cysteine S-methyltransferase [Idiomarina abyssalis]|tara:strand:+ start:43 stop:885 length:843 start_codon:yes stop_codon:yes gene_type:complete